MKDCLRCKDLQVRFDIRFPSDLRQAMHVAKGNIADETLELLDDDGEEWITPFRDVSADGPWNDIVHYEFRCTSCGRKFRLSVETYHGQGGAWSPCNF